MKVDFVGRWFKCTVSKMNNNLNGYYKQWNLNTTATQNQSDIRKTWKQTQLDQCESFS